MEIAIKSGTAHLNASESYLEHFSMEPARVELLEIEVPVANRLGEGIEVGVLASHDKRRRVSVVCRSSLGRFLMSHRTSLLDNPPPATTYVSQPRLDGN